MTDEERIQRVRQLGRDMSEVLATLSRAIELSRAALAADLPREDIIKGLDVLLETTRKCAGAFLFAATESEMKK